MKDYLNSLKDEMSRDLRSLIQIKTIYDGQSVGGSAPFGLGIREGFDFIHKRALEEGLISKDINGYAMHVEYGKGEKIVALLCHMDTVGIDSMDEWLSDPYQLLEKDGIWYGRGVNDNKGPLIGCLYLLIALKRLNIETNMTIRLIIGGAEETTWEGIRQYFLHEAMPIIGISPDGNFPIVQCEKGVRYYTVSGYELNNTIRTVFTDTNRHKVCDHVKVTMAETNEVIEFAGLAAPSRHPERGQNAVNLMARTMLGSEPMKVISCINKYLDTSWIEEDVTHNISSFNYNMGKWSLEFDVRWSSSYDEKKLDNKIMSIFYGVGYIEISKLSKPCHHVPSDAPLISYLKGAYFDVMHKEAQLITKGGASYARALGNAVAFGPCFEGEITNAHKANEQQLIGNLFEALEIYWKFLERCGAINEG